ncbi:MAG: hypothetical protein NC398_07205 [Acetatifactor muris]|nr:hypothetical protein [Acetatifactor muris]MCM1525725.1 hypothetical protein [Bacteroides sp.]
MNAVIKHNGRIIQEGLCLVDTSKGSTGVILETAETPSRKIDIQKGRGFVEVNIWGILEPLED